MSLINQMLKDLDARRAQHEHGDQVHASAQTATAPRRVWPAVALAIILTGSSAAALWWWLGDPAPAPTSAPAQRLTDAGQNPNNPAQPATQSDTNRPGAPEQSVAPSSATDIARDKGQSTPARAAPVASTDKAGSSPDKPETTATESAAKSTPSASVADADEANPPAESAVKTQSRKQLSAADGDNGSMQKSPSQPKPEAQARTAYAQGRERLQRGDAAGAIRAWRTALAADGSFHPAREALAAELEREGRLSAAADVLQRGMQQFPEHRAFGERLARQQLASDDAQAAIATLDAMPAPALSADRDYYALLAAARQRSGDDTGAIAVYRQLTAQDSDNAAWWVGLGLSLERTHKAEAARQAYQRALQSPQRSATLEQFARQRLSQLPASTQ